MGSSDGRYLTFVFNTLLDAPLPTPGLLGQSYNFLSVTVTSGSSTVTNQVVPYDVVYSFAHPEMRDDFPSRLLARSGTVSRPAATGLS